MIVAAAAVAKPAAASAAPFTKAAARVEIWVNTRRAQRTLAAAFGDALDGTTDFDLEKTLQSDVSPVATVRGIDLDLRQSFDLDAAGKLNLDLQWSHISTFERKKLDGSSLEFAGTHGNCDVTNCIGTPKDRINFGATWERGPWSLSGIVNYIGGFKNVRSQGATCASRYADGSDAPGGCRIASFTTLDLSSRWRARDGVEVFGSIQNLTDKIAPLDPLTYGAINYNPMHSSGAIGRYFTLGVKYSFQ